MESWRAWYLFEAEMAAYVKKKLRGRFFDRKEDNDEEIKMIIDFTKK